MERTLPPLILGIESSCDDTSAAVIRGSQVLSNVVANQALHAEVGGVVPEWASSAHLSKIHPVVQAALDKSGIKASELDAVAYTLGPGLQGSLHVGTSYAKSYAWGLGVPPSPCITCGRTFWRTCFSLTRSAGLSVFVLDRQWGTHPACEGQRSQRHGGLGPNPGRRGWRSLRQGGQVDWVALSRRPCRGQVAKQGDPKAFAFSRPRMEGYNWSFSGLKTAGAEFLQREQAKDTPIRGVATRRHLCVRAGRHLGHVDGPFAASGRGHGNHGGGHRRRCQCQFRTAGPAGRRRRPTWLDRSHSAHVVLHRQRRNGCGGRVVGRDGLRGWHAGCCALTSLARAH